MSSIARLGGHVSLVPGETDDESLTVGVSLRAWLDDGRLVETDPAWDTSTMARRGIAAIGVSYDAPLTELPGIDQDLFAREPERALTEALDRHYRLRPKDIEDVLRVGLEIDPELRSKDYEEDVDDDESELTPEEEAELSPWANLVRGMREAGIDANADTLLELARKRFDVEFDPEVIAELNKTP